jgi:hypothetical protein
MPMSRLPWISRLTPLQISKPVLSLLLQFLRWPLQLFSVRLLCLAFCLPVGFQCLLPAFCLLIWYLLPPLLLCLLPLLPLRPSSIVHLQFIFLVCFPLVCRPIYWLITLLWKVPPTVPPIKPRLRPTFLPSLLLLLLMIRIAKKTRSCFQLWIWLTFCPIQTKSRCA